MTHDTAVINVPLSKRGNIDAQIDAYKKAAKGRSIQRNRNGVLLLFKGNLPQVFANRTQAEKAAVEWGGTAYQSAASSRFLVKFEGECHEQPSPQSRQTHRLTNPSSVA